MATIPTKWLTRARCAEYGPTWLEDLDQDQQLADCRRCTVREECLAAAIVTGAVDVVQAGLVIGSRPIKGIVEVLEDDGEVDEAPIYRNGSLVVNPNVCDVCRRPRHKNTHHHDYLAAVEPAWMAQQLGWL